MNCSPSDPPPIPPPRPATDCVPAIKAAPSEWHVLVVDTDLKTAQLVSKAAIGIPGLSEGHGPTAGAANGSKAQPAAPPGAMGAHVRSATSLDAAQAEMLRRPADVLLVNLQIQDQSGIGLIADLKQRYPATDIIALSRSRSSELCLDAWRAGAADLLVAPYSAGDLRRALSAASERRSVTQRHAQRHQRLRAVCRRLNKARHEISQQVDLLCNDLVRAYQEMAQQLNVTQTASDFAQALSGEIDVEGTLRRTMEWVLKKLGPINAAIYLPTGQGDEPFTLGAYLNLDTHADGPLIEALGRTLVRQARSGGPVAVDSDATLEQRYGKDARRLKGRAWLAVACHTPRDCMGVLVVFHGKSQLSTSVAGGSTRALIESVAPILADRMEQALGLYHRLHPFPEEEA